MAAAERRVPSSRQRSGRDGGDSHVYALRAADGQVFVTVGDGAWSFAEP